MSFSIKMEIHLSLSESCGWRRENGKKIPLGGTMKPEINYENVKNIRLALVCESGKDWNLYFFYMSRNESAADGIC